MGWIKLTDRSADGNSILINTDSVKTVVRDTSMPTGSVVKYTDGTQDSVGEEVDDILNLIASVNAQR